MEDKQPKQYPNKSITIRRSKRRFTIVQWWYLRVLGIFAGMMLMFALITVFDPVENTTFTEDFFEKSSIYSVASLFASLFYSFINKGSLVETVHIDYIKQEIRVLRYTLWGRQRKVVISFKGFSWDVLPGGKSPDRLRLFPLASDRIVICEGTLGWTGDDCDCLKEALSDIVDKDFWLNQKPSGQW